MFCLRYKVFMYFENIESLSLICKILSMQNYEDVINNGPFIISNGMG